MSRCTESSVCRNPILGSKVGLVSVPKFPPIPRLSIVVPIGQDIAAFESTLISVLENPVDGGEVLVCHDGTYTDPFDLGSEVRFVVADSAHPLDLISAGASQSRGRFVHLLADGIQATSGWTEGALERFEDYDCGVVAPVIRHVFDGRIVSAGWCDSTDRLCKSAHQGRITLEASAETESAIGAHLQASFWRRELIRSLCDSFISSDCLEACYAFHHLACQAGWKCCLAADCELHYPHESLAWDQSSLGRGLRTQCLKNHFSRGGWTQSITAAISAGLASLTRPKQMAEAIGRGLAPTGTASLLERLDANQVTACDQHEMVVSIPRGEQTLQPRKRRAA